MRSLASRQRDWPRRVALACGALAIATTAVAEQLPLRRYSTVDGLAQERVKCLVRDRRGFLWACTAWGLSRFDGVRFTSYGEAEGFPNPSVNHLVHAPDGTYWVAANGGGILRFESSLDAIEPAPPDEGTRTTPRSFRVYRVGESAASNRVNVLYIDRRGALWAGTDKDSRQRSSGHRRHPRSAS